MKWSGKLHSRERTAPPAQQLRLKKKKNLANPQEPKKKQKKNSLRYLSVRNTYSFVGGRTKLQWRSAS